MSTSDAPPGPARPPGGPLPPLREVNERLVIAALAEQEQKERAEGHAAEMDALLGSLHDGVVVLDPAGRITLANEAARHILRLPADPADAASRPPVHLPLHDLEGDPVPADEAPFHVALRGERFNGREYLLMHPGAAAARISFSGSAIRDRAGCVTCALAVCRDVTELRALERLKQDYVSLISHDLRNPLTAILFVADFLQNRMEREGAGDNARHLQSIQLEAERMNAMIGDLLEAARMDSGGLALRSAPTDLVALVAALAGRLGTDGARVRVHADGPAPIPHVPADGAHMERVVMNLVTNALKYSEPGSPVTIRIEPAPGEVRVSVTDRGRGIAADDLLRVFDRFFRVSRRDHHGGVGLGLYISRMIVQEHGGRIWAESVVGEGSTFAFALPLG